MHARFLRHVLSSCAAFALSVDGLSQGLMLEAVSDGLTRDFGVSLRGLGDIDGDGVRDFAAGGKRDNSWRGMVYVYSGATRMPVYAFLGTASGDRFGFAIAGVGDVDADGRDDIGIGAPLASGGGAVRILSGVNGATLWTWNNVATVGFGSTLDGAGDMDADGHTDVVIGSEAHDGAAGLDTGLVVVLSGKDGSQLFQKEGLANERIGSVVRGGHDLNFDGRPDVLVTSIGSPPSKAGYARVYSRNDRRPGPQLASDGGRDGLRQYGRIPRRPGW